MASRASTSEHDRIGHAPASRYLVVWVALIVGTLATFLSSRLHIPHPYGLVVAILIACAKSALVVMFFMHLWDHGGANRLVFVTSVVFVALLIGLVVLDNVSRFPLTNPPHGRTLDMEPPGPDILTPRGPPAPGPSGPPGEAAPAGR